MTSSKECFDLESTYNAPNYHPLGDGVFVWDPEGKKYYDFLAAYGAVNQGHCHPKIKEALVEQLGRCCVSSRAFYNDQLGPFAKFCCEFFGYEMILPMNSGAEGVETALKAARKWAYMVKKVPSDQAKIVTAENNFHGRTTTIVSFSTDPVAKTQFGPFTPGFLTIPYNDVDALEAVLKDDPTIAAYLVEPIQGEAGVVVPQEGYMKKCYDICKKYNVLLIADEIQTGMGRTGKVLCVEHDNVKPDIVIVGKAVSGGFYPVSIVMSSKEVLSCIRPGEHGSTFGGNPLACAVAKAAIKTLVEEKMPENAARLGEIFRERIRAKKCPFVKEVRGRGLMNAVVVGEIGGGKTAWDLCLLCASKGMLCKPTHNTIVRLTPPLVITEEQLNECADTFVAALDEIQAMEKEDIPRSGM